MTLLLLFPSAAACDGIFDSGIFDSGIFDICAETPAAAEQEFTGGGSKRYWRWIAGKVSEDDVRRIYNKLRGVRGEAKKKKKRRPTILRMAEEVRREAERLPEAIPPDAREVLAAMGVLDPPAMLDQAAYAKALRRDRDRVEAAYLAVMEQRAAEAADDEEVLQLYLERRRRIVEAALKLMQAKKAA